VERLSPFPYHAQKFAVPLRPFTYVVDPFGADWHPNHSTLYIPAQHNVVEQSQSPTEPSEVEMMYTEQNASFDPAVEQFRLAVAFI
jgi:hypothetical protein